MSDKIRRKPEAIIKSLEMSPDKKVVFVEGKRDRLFFEYLFDYDKDIYGTIFLEIDTVDISDNLNGNRGRLISFAEIIEKSQIDINIKCFIDADYHHILKNEKFPKHLIITDFKDLESYLYEEKYFSKFINIGLGTDKINSDFIFEKILDAKETALLRICSIENDLELPFKGMSNNFSKNYSLTKGVNIDKYCTTLIQKCRKKIDLKTLIKELEVTKSKYQDKEIKFLLHGKDVLEIIKEIAKYCNKSKDNIDAVFWMSFDKNDINNYPALVQLKEFVSA